MARVFGGSSHPTLTESICGKLGTQPAKCDLGQFANGEISVQIGISGHLALVLLLTCSGCSIRDKDVFVVQSSSSKYDVLTGWRTRLADRCRINNSIMELLIMISACKGGSANKITGTSYCAPASRRV